MTTNGPKALDNERPTAALRDAVVDGLLIEEQIVPMDRALATLDSKTDVPRNRYQC